MFEISVVLECGWILLVVVVVVVVVGCGLVMWM